MGELIVKKKNYKDRVKINNKVVVTGLAITLVFLFLIGRLSYIMIVKGPDYAGMAEEQWTSEVKIDAVRGKKRGWIIWKEKAR